MYPSKKTYVLMPFCAAPYYTPIRFAGCWWSRQAYYSVQALGIRCISRFVDLEQLIVVEKKEVPKISHQHILEEFKA